ncbi:hypothetical protein EOPP23_07590 [Endozoicomonas sp. OPT23]|uniref:YdcF family protein n=1 Tax=Endozoicomonas sp. OPT23 TaxID=2072845 RepID=UPI00129AFDE0|nr:YdcF family protein [Endozoicomonas sp. OPT23]MRI32846.1 hypothetical protein [Endozoicomonas sp. OPT23]
MDNMTLWLMFRRLVKLLLRPLTLIIMLMVAGMTLKGMFSGLAVFALSLLYLLSVAPVSTLLLKGLERYPAIQPESCPEADFIVLLGAGRPYSSPEMDEPLPTALSLERIRYAAILAKRCELPVMTSGGGKFPEAETMTRVLEQDYGVKTKWVESSSRTTFENAANARELLGRQFNRVMVVTHAWHMPRAVMSFKGLGFEVIPAPTSFTWKSVPWNSPAYWIPSSRQLMKSELALHEYLGIVWYWVTGKLS